MRRPRSPTEQQRQPTNSSTLDVRTPDPTSYCAAGPVPAPCPTTALEVAASKSGPSGERRFQKFDRAAPGEIGCFLIIAGFGSVVVEGVIGAFININLVFNPCRLE